MKPHTTTTLSQLRHGDRFYFTADRKRSPWQLFESDGGEPLANMVAPGMPGGFAFTLPRAFKPPTEVVFLRHTHNSLFETDALSGIV